ncbi:ANM_HP_G0005230.mRNA.1.CDS.1 [Saccharomyces cerevisiae]|nr:ANM_HP_G0119830.mRNA.1.CDS.1 [Saccharomyces cerevisiae]CAI5219673.1 ANM_HP_G0034340.mRNA.1.CDS.1 [Saccharomyces cerevisiae]CAI5226241.1 ANM_HP_G0005230.mRNA.1.CDS.1 [Saccharomyces cerevisiae]CAI6551133.1 ANM_HP_G0119830.mRNA.1.CDS.1 [Saccharomyces cerevisiae]CAI7025190.1 ANM_HP_G0034340.mRNA.1.CDS.1 [Saccharomyces cerevisiae]
MDDICSIAENINRTLFNILGTEIDFINLNTNNLYNFIMESNLTKVEQHTLHKNISNNRLEIYHHIKKEKSPKGKSSISPQARAFLEQVFRRKQSLNSKEKEEVANKCGITPLQVRVWSGFSFSFSFPQQYNFINPGFGFVEWLTNNYAEVRGDGYWEDVFVHLAL